VTVRVKRRVHRRINGRWRTITISRSVVLANGPYAVPTGAERTTMLHLRKQSVHRLAPTTQWLPARAVATLIGGTSASRMVRVRLMPPRR
jgi:hypothetical protein